MVVAAVFLRFLILFGVDGSKSESVSSFIDFCKGVRVECLTLRRRPFISCSSIRFDKTTLRFGVSTSKWGANVSIKSKID